MLIFTLPYQEKDLYMYIYIIYYQVTTNVHQKLIPIAETCTQFDDDRQAWIFVVFAFNFCDVTKKGKSVMFSFQAREL